MTEYDYDKILFDERLLQCSLKCNKQHNIKKTQLTDNKFQILYIKGKFFVKVQHESASLFFFTGLTLAVFLVIWSTKSPDYDLELSRNGLYSFCCLLQA